jgi:glycerophosphoryl diester phosphodiesterase
MVGPPLLLGHRGARSSPGIPENTFASFDLALKHGCDGFEFDVRVTACHTAVVCHDPKVGKVAVSTARAVDLPQLPRLDDVLRRYGPGAFLNIEIKVADLESIMLAALNEHPPAQGYVVTSFLPDVIMELEARNAKVSIGIICEKPAQLARGRDLPIDYIVLHHSLVDRLLVRDLHSAGHKIFVWTVNQGKEMLRLADWGVDGIISDDTELLVKTLS